MATHNNFLVKVTDATMPQVRKALQEAGIEVRSILSMHKEEIEEAGDAQETGPVEEAGAE